MPFDDAVGHRIREHQEFVPCCENVESVCHGQTRVWGKTNGFNCSIDALSTMGIVFDH